jgi:hypothetical protein
MTIDELIPQLLTLDGSSIVTIGEFGRQWNERPADDKITTRRITRNGATYTCVVLKPTKWP